jgi:hypothetical protein
LLTLVSALYSTCSGDRRQADRQQPFRLLIARPPALIGLWLPALIGLWLTTLAPLFALFMRRSFIMHQCFAVVWSLEVNFRQIEFIKQ